MKKLLNNDIVNLVQSIKKYYGLKNEHKSNEQLDLYLQDKKPKHIVFFCLDGLGFDLLDNASFLKKNIFQKIDSVFPPTTACATISLQSGLYPCEHSWIGWAQYISEYDEIIELFSETGYYNKIKYDLSVVDDIKYKKYYEDIKNGKEFFPDFVLNGSKTFDDMLEKVKTHIDNTETSFSYAYWTEPDHILHATGTKSKESIEMIKSLDAKVKEFCENLEDTVVILTADHGHIDTENIKLHDYPKLMDCLKRLPSIEARCISLFVEEDMHEQFNIEIKPLLKYFDLYTKDQFINSEFFNFAPINKRVYSFLGEYILIAKDKYILVSKEVELVTMHGGGLASEMEVPLVIIAK